MRAPSVRSATPGDAPAMAALLNAIIAIGGTTAHELPFSPERARHDYVDGPDAIACHLAFDGDRLLGFQALGRHALLPAGWADIGTFVAPGLQRGGVGGALFTASRAAAQAAGLAVLNATIRADNLPGLGYYRRLGFLDYASDPDFCLKDGTRVGRVSRRMDLSA